MSEDKIKISIITVCKNAADTIEKTFDSILGQTYKNIEVIVIDGVSIDGTLDIINKYKQNISYFVSEKDSGVYNAMNKGIKEATGDLLYFLNANDTLYDENVLANVVKAYEEYPDAKFIYGEVKFIYDKSKFHITEFINADNVFCFYEKGFNHQGIFYKKELFEKYGLYDESYKILADNVFNAEVCVKNKEKMLFVPIIVANFDANGISDINNPAFGKFHQQERNKMLEMYFPWYHKFYKLIKTVKYFSPYFYAIYFNSAFLKKYLYNRVIISKSLLIK